MDDFFQRVEERAQHVALQSSNVKKNVIVHEYRAGKIIKFLQFRHQFVAVSFHHSKNVKRFEALQGVQH
jgi:hypothetical protein